MWVVASADFVFRGLDPSASLTELAVGAASLECLDLSDALISGGTSSERRQTAWVAPDPALVMFPSDLASGTTVSCPVGHVHFAELGWFGIRIGTGYVGAFRGGDAVDVPTRESDWRESAARVEECFDIDRLCRIRSHASLPK